MVLVRTASVRRFKRVPTIYVLSKNKKNIVYPCKPQFFYIKVGFKGVKIILACFRDVSRNKKNNIYPCKPQFYKIKSGVQGGQYYIDVFS